MTDVATDMDQLIRDAIDREGPKRAPTALAVAVLSRTESMRQRRPLVRVLDREAWPPRRGSVADPATWRVLRVGIAMMVVAALLTTALFIGSRLTERTPRLDYPGTLTTVGTLSARWEWPIAVPVDDRRVLVTGFPATAGALLGEIIDVTTGVTVLVPWPNPAMSIERAVRLDDGRVAVLAWIPLGSGPTGRSMLMTVDADGTATEVAASLQPRLGAAMALLEDGRLLLAGGLESQESTEVLGSAEVVDVRSGTVTTTGSLLQPRADADLTRLVDGRVLLSGGTAIDREALGPGVVGPELAQGVTELEVYDPDTGEFVAAGRLPTVARAVPPVRLSDGRVVIFGPSEGQFCGRHDIDPTFTFIFDPAGDTVSLGQRAPHAPAAAAPLRDGTVLLAGYWSAMGPAPGGCRGPGTNPYVTDAWIGTLDPVSGATRVSLDPFTGESTLDGDPLLPLGGAAALADGRVVLVTWPSNLTDEEPVPPTTVVLFE